MAYHRVIFTGKCALCIKGFLEAKCCVCYLRCRSLFLGVDAIKCLGIRSCCLVKRTYRDVIRKFGREFRILIVHWCRWKSHHDLLALACFYCHFWIRDFGPTRSWFSLAWKCHYAAWWLQLEPEVSKKDVVSICGYFCAQTEAALSEWHGLPWDRLHTHTMQHWISCCNAGVTVHV